MPPNSRHKYPFWFWCVHLLVLALFFYWFYSFLIGNKVRADLIPPPPPLAGPACAGGNSVLGYVTSGTHLTCGTALASGSIANGASQLGVYIGTNSIGPLTPGGDVSFANPNFSVNSARGGAITIPNVTDTVALLGTAQTLTNKTVNCANNTCSVRANLDLTGILASGNFPAMTGDVSNVAGSLATTVGAFQGRPMAATAPTSGQLIGWNGSTWGPVTAPTSGINALTQDVTASGTGSQVATVVGLQGRPISNVAPGSSQFLGWTGSAWAPANVPSGGLSALTQDVTAAGSGSQPAQVIGLQGRPLASTAPTTNQVIGWNGSTWLPVAQTGGGGITGLQQDVTATGPGLANATITTGAVTSGKMAAGAAASNVGSLSGDLSGSLPNPTINSGAVTSAKMAGGAAAGNVGALNGDLSGTLPTTTVVGIQGHSVCSTAPIGSQVLLWNGSCYAPAATPVNAINQLTGDATASGQGSVPITLASTGVTAGSYQMGSTCLTVNVKGLITNVVAGTCGGGSLLTGGGAQLTGGGVNLVE